MVLARAGSVIDHIQIRYSKQNLHQFLPAGMLRTENAVTVNLNECAKCVSGRRPGANWRRGDLSQASHIKVGLRSAGVDGPAAAGSRVSYWYGSTKPGSAAEKVTEGCRGHRAWARTPECHATPPSLFCSWPRCWQLAQTH